MKYDETHLAKHHTLRFKRRSDLLKFHYERPGALAAHFLMQVRQRMGRAPPKDSGELVHTDVAGWVSLHSERKDVRDQKEVAFLGRVLQDMAMDRLPQLADVVAMRIREIRAAKKEGGTWEKANVVSLLPGSHAGNAPVVDGAFTL